MPPHLFILDLVVYVYQDVLYFVQLESRLSVIYIILIALKIHTVLKSYGDVQILTHSEWFILFLFSINSSAHQVIYCSSGQFNANLAQKYSLKAEDWSYIFPQQIDILFCIFET